MVLAGDDSADDDGSSRLGGPLLYVLLRANRWALTVAVLASVFIVLVLASRLGLSPLREIVEAQDGLEFLFSAFIGAIITGTSIVVTINQLVLSQELGAVGDQRERMNESMSFRRDVEDATGIDVSEPEPAAFVQGLLESIRSVTEELQEIGRDCSDQEARSAIEEYTADLLDSVDEAHETLEGAQFGTFEVIWAALTFDYSRKIYDARSLQSDHGDVFSSDTDSSIDELLDLLTLFGPTREHFKTLYFQWELIKLSRALLYVSVPALTVMALMIMYIDADALPGSTAGIDNLVWLTSIGFVIGIVPFVIFIVFILRIATVAKRTLAMGPFLLRETEQ